MLDPGGKFRTTHTMEIGFMFDNVERGQSLNGVGPRQDQLAQRMSGAWAAFARTGDPNHKGLPAWPAYDTPSRATMLFDDECAVVYDPAHAERALFPPL